MRMTLDDDFKICLLPYKGESLKSVIGWDGFISPDGEFYKVCESGELSYIHDAFVEVFTDIKFGCNNLEKTIDFLSLQGHKMESKSNKDIFIDFYGFVNVQFIKDINKNNGKQELIMEIGLPSDVIGHNLTGKQSETIYSLAKINGVSSKNLSFLKNNDNIGKIREALLDETGLYSSLHYELVYVKR